MSEDKIEVLAEIHENVEEEQEEPRERRLTQKGLQYTIKMKQKRLDQLCRGLERYISLILDMMDRNIENKGEVTDRYKSWIGLYDQLLEADEQYRKLLTPPELQDYDDNWYAGRNLVMTDFKSTVEQWLLKKPDDPEDDALSISSKNSSRRSVVSNKSTKLKEQEKRAELLVKGQQMQKRQLEQEKLNLKMKEDKLKLEEELALSEAKCKIIEEEEEEKLSNKSTTSSDKDSVMLSLVRHLNKPTCELSKFSGDPLQYHKFMRQFKTKVVAHCTDDDELLNYLDQYTAGEANKIVVGFSYLNATQGYKAALKELEQRYGDPEVTVNAFVTKALTWNLIKPDNPKELDNFAVFLSECENAIESLDALKVLEYSENFRKIVSKLPYVLHDRWRNIVFQHKEDGKRVKFSDLVKFVRKEAKKSNDPTFGRLALGKEQQDLRNAKKSFGTNPTHKKSSSFATRTDDTNNEQPKASESSGDKKLDAPKINAFTSPCTYCSGPHALEACKNLTSLPFYERIDILKLKGYCYGCLRRGHQKRDCRNKATCTNCNGRHPSVLHVNGRIPSRTDATVKNSSDTQVKTTASTCLESSFHTGSNMRAGNTEVTMAIVPVNVHLHGCGNVVKTYAFLDPGSNVSFCSEALMYQLGIEGRHRKLTIDTMGSKHTMDTYEVKNIEVSDLTFKNTIKLPVLYTKDRIPVSEKHIPRSEDIISWPHLSDVILPNINGDIGLLLGNNIPDAYSPLEVKVGPQGSPHATRTRIGWIAWNVVREVSCNTLISVNRADVLAVEQAEALQNLEVQYQKSVAIDFPERSKDEKREYSQEDHRFLEKMAKSKRMDDGHYELCLPFKDHSQTLPNNQFLALQRLKNLQKKLEKNKHFHEDYTQFMSILIKYGHAEVVPENERHGVDGHTWYLPHHGVYHPKKPNKIRIVFDCSSKYRGIALNDVLLQGPDLTNSLLGILLKFRKESVAVMADIEKMFYQVKVTKEDRDYLRFYWWPDGNLTAEPVIYRMTVHIFGAVSSPSCANYALHATAEDNNEYFDLTVSQSVKNNFYVDDLLHSVPTDEEAINLIHDLSFLCELGGFKLTKWVTNSRNVLHAIPEHERATTIKDLSFESVPLERALGVTWDIKTDSFGFQIALKDCKPTRRNILSIVSSMYDPLGLAAPFTLSAKILLQELCQKGADWDTELTDNDLHRWKQWLSELPTLEEFTVPRYLKSSQFKGIMNLQLHMFSDASELGYGVTAYLRFEDINAHVQCCMLLSRSRVAPLKKTTMPRMELTAATVGVRLAQKICQEMDLHVQQIYWTDSMSVIRYIANTKTRFHTFVANRLSVIRDCSSVDQWRYVGSKANPADLASRGTSVDDLMQNDSWINGPKFLLKPESQWPKMTEGLKLHSEDPEVKCVVNTSMVTTEMSLIDRLLLRTSSWLKLKRTTAWIMIMLGNLRKWVAQRKVFEEQQEENVEEKMLYLKNKAMSQSRERLKSIYIEADMMSKAETFILQAVQRQHYQKELKDLSTATSGVNKSSELYKLDPFVLDNVLRVGGRLSKSTLPYGAKHQIILPQQSTVSKLILRDIHSRVGHQGRNAMLTELRKSYWIPRIASAIKEITSKCVICRKYRTKLLTQKMADLPENRLEPDLPPFSHVGIDYFGPIEVKRGRVTVKRYGVIFTCFTSRAVHLEIAFSLNTDSCILAIRRFLARRGNVISIRSDNGTNLVGAEKELKENLEHWNHSKIGRELQQRHIKWDFNPPSGSHFGGVWERLIRMIRKVLYSLLREQVIHMDDEGLQTLICEVENILNSRPISLVSNHPNDLDALTPNHLLLHSAGDSLPCGVFDKGDIYSRRRWRQIQFLADMFWKRWKSEYLPLLQERQKWLKPQHNLQIGDIIMMMDNPRNTWILGKVIDITKDRKGLVRIVQVKTATTVLQRPVHKLVLVLEAESA